MKKTTRLCAILLPVAGCLMAANAAATVRYVAADGTGDGASWTNASSDLQAMIDASTAGDEVWVKTGTYKAAKLIDERRNRSYSFILKSGVSLYGGFAGMETAKEERSRGANPYEWTNETILSADDDVPDVWVRELESGSTHRYSWTITGNTRNSNHILYNTDGLTEKTEISGFTMKGAFADVYQVYAGGAAIYANGWLEVRGCTFKENASHFKAESTRDYYGGAVTILSTETTKGKAAVEDCLFENNLTKSSYGNSYGGGIFIDGGSVKNCTFKGCVSLDYGGAVYNNGGTVENCTFDDCYSAAGGAVVNAGGTVTNIVATNCRSLQGGAVYNSGSLSYAKIANCYSDSEDYSTMGGKGGGIYNKSGRILGCVVTNCSSYDGGGIYIEAGTIVNSTVQRNSVRNTESTQTANIAGAVTTDNILNTIGNPDADAANFVKPSSFAGWSIEEAKEKEALEASWELAAGSSFIDSGTPPADTEETTDIAGNPRISGTSIDVGAYEFVPQEPQEPNLILTFETDDRVTFGTGGYDGSSFSVDWGDGILETYEGAKNITGTPIGKVVKIYGEELVILKAINVGLTAVDMTNSATISQVQVGQNKLTTLDVSGNTSLTGLYCEQNQITSLDVSKLASMRVLDCHDNKLAGILDCSAMTSLSKVDCSQNELTELVLPEAPQLVTVYCSYNKLTSLDLTKAKGLTEVECNNNEIASLDISKNQELTELYCPTNKLKTLDTSGNTKLETLTAFENEIESVDLSNNTSLTGLYLQDNMLSDLNLSKNPNLQWIAVSGNELGALDLSEQTSISSLLASDNKLTSLDITGNPRIFRLEVDNNQLSEINVTNQSSLSTFILSNNLISKLDLSKNAYLYWLVCDNNNIETLDLSANTYLQKFVANGNKLKQLNLSKNTGLQGVLLQGNQMNGTAINDIIAALPDVSSVEINDNNRDWGRQLNVSNMPGTPETKTADAEAKGWIVTAIGGGGDGSADSIESNAAALAYNPTASLIIATQTMNCVKIFTASGQTVMSVAETSQISVAELPTGIYVARATDASGQTHTLKFMRR